MSDTTNKLVPPLTFRLYQTIKFNRPVDKEKDCISPGGYTLKMKDEDGIEKSVMFDFETYEGNISNENPSVVTCIQNHPDYGTFDDLREITEHMLRNVTDVIEWFICTWESVKGVEPLVPIEISDVMFEIVGDSTDRDVEFVQIPITTPIPYHAFSL